MIMQWERTEDCWMNIGSPDIVQWQQSRGYLDTPRRESSPFGGVKKTVCGYCGAAHRRHYDKKRRCIRDLSCGDVRIYLAVEVRRVLCRRCTKVKREELKWLATPPFYTKRFAFHVGRKCRSMTVKDVAKELKLDWHTVKTLEKE